MVGIRVIVSGRLRSSFRITVKVAVKFLVMDKVRVIINLLSVLGPYLLLWFVLGLGLSLEIGLVLGRNRVRLLLVLGLGLVLGLC
jgi:hypothetical protein